MFYAAYPSEANPQYCTVRGFEPLYGMVHSAGRRVSLKIPRRSPKANSKRPAFDVTVFLDSAGLRRTISKFRKKETLFVQGDPAKTVMYIQEGSVKLKVVNESGKEAVVALLGPGDFLGQGCPYGTVQIHGDSDCDHADRCAGH